MNEALMAKVRKGAELCRYDPDPGQECKIEKTNKVPEEEGSVDERLSANGSQERTLSKSRENEALMESQAVPAWAKTHTLSSPPLLVFSPSLSRTLKLSRSEKLHGWPLSDRTYALDRTYARFTEALRNPRR